MFFDRFIKNIKKNKGISLVGVLIAVTILSMLAISSLKMIEQQSRNSLHSQQKFEVITLHNEVRAFL